MKFLYFKHFFGQYFAVPFLRYDIQNGTSNMKGVIRNPHKNAA